MQMADEQLEEERRSLGSRIRILFSLDGRTFIGELWSIFSILTSP